MNRYSESSRRQLATCHPDLRLVMATVLPEFDHKVIEGHRPTERQKELYAQGRTEPGEIITHVDGVTKKSRHQSYPSEAVDVMPWPMDWGDRERMTFFAGVVLGTAARLLADGKITHRIRWGGDWDRDTEVKDNSFDDLPHFELVKP